MENRLENIENIMKEYNDIKDSLEPKIDENLAKEIENKKQELDREEKILQAFKDELNSLNTAEMDYVQMHVTMGNYNRYIQEEQEKVNLIKKEYEKKLSEKEKIENPDLTLDQKREKKSKTYEARDNAKKKLISEQKEIEMEIEEQDLEFKSTMLKLKKFKHEYEEQEQSWEERDNEGKLVTVTKKVKVCTNGEEYKKLDDKLKETTDNLSKLKEAKSKCEKYLAEIDNEYEKDVSKINEVISRKGPKEEKKPEDSKTSEPKQTESEEKTPKEPIPNPAPAEPINTVPKEPKQNPIKTTTTPRTPEPEPMQPRNIKLKSMGKELVDIKFSAKNNSYSLVIKGEDGHYIEKNENYNELIQSKKFDDFKSELYAEYKEEAALKDIDPCVAYMLHQADEELGQNRLDNYVAALGKKDKMSDFTAIRYDLNGIINGIYGKNYSKESSNAIMENANHHAEIGLANVVDKSSFIKFMEKHKHIRSAFQSISKIGMKSNKALNNRKIEKLEPAKDEKSIEEEKLKEKHILKYLNILEERICSTTKEEELLKSKEEIQKLYDEGKILTADYENINFDIEAKTKELESIKKAKLNNEEKCPYESVEPEKTAFRDKYKVDQSKLGYIAEKTKYDIKLRQEKLR